MIQNKPIFKNKPNKSYIVNDNEINKPKLIWDSRSVAVNVIVIIFVDSIPYVLASKRGPKAADFQGLMNVVAGYIDWDESGQEAAFREVWEETGLNLRELIKNNSLLSYNLLQPWYVKTDPSANKQNITLRYGVALKLDKKPDLNVENNEIEGEVEDPQWLPLDKIFNYKWAFDHDKLINEYFELHI